MAMQQDFRMAGRDVLDIEPSWQDVLDDRLRTRGDAPYQLASLAEVAARLDRFLAVRMPGVRAESVQRMSGGGSKEQFVFDTVGVGTRRRYVLRMDPTESVVATSRRREMEALALLAPSVPVPEPIWLDADGDAFGQPAMIMAFCDGVTKPTASAAGNIVGIGSIMGDTWRERLRGPFVEHLAAIHNVPWQAGGRDCIGVPDADPQQAARWQVNAWARVWEEDKVSSLPTMALARRWMLERLPKVERLAFVHGDYRAGNYLFDEASGLITAVLDLEMAHIGDHHEDLAWAMQRANGSVEDGIFYGSGLMRPDDFYDAYERASGRVVDGKTMHFYFVFAVYKSMCISLATAMQVARLRHSHQDVLLTWMAGCGHVLHAQLCELLDTEAAA